MSDITNDTANEQPAPAGAALEPETLDARAKIS